MKDSEQDKLTQRTYSLFLRTVVVVFPDSFASTALTHAVNENKGELSALSPAG